MGTSCGAGELFHSYHFNNELKGPGFNVYYPGKDQDLPLWEFKFARPLPLSGIKMGSPRIGALSPGRDH